MAVEDGNFTPEEASALYERPIDPEWPKQRKEFLTWLIKMSNHRDITFKESAEINYGLLVKRSMGSFFGDLMDDMESRHQENLLITPTHLP